MDITQKIKDYYQNEPDGETRAYIGASSIGHECTAMLAFSHRGYPNTPPDEQLKRIFRDGHRIEDLVVKDMTKAGIHVMEKDPMTGKQWRYTDYEGNSIGNADGIVELHDGSSAILEIKSMNDQKFKEFLKKGIKTSHPIYYAQMQYLMGLSKCQKAVLVSYNKNNSQYHHEWVAYDIFYYNSLRQKIEDIINGLGRKLSKDESDWRCRGCFKREVCWHGKEPERTKRTCGNSKAQIDSSDWVCSKGCGETCEDWIRYEPLQK